MLSEQPTSTPLLPGTLFVVSLPIGNPEDITLRALRVLQSVKLIVAENSRVCRSLLEPYGVATETVSMSVRHGTPALSSALTCLEAGNHVALVSDCGTPALVDPGQRLLQIAIQRAYPVNIVPGATACIAALVLSGFATAPFRFLGTPPRSTSERSAFFARFGEYPDTAILYESPRYLRSTLSALCRNLEASRKIVVACDLTHTNERIFRGTINEALTEYTHNTPRGAYTLVISGRSSSENS